MVERKEYLDQLWAWKDERQIKVVTGIRRCGKSVLLEQYQQRLLANGVAPEQIISINFENLDYEPLKDYMRLYNYLKERLCVDKMTLRTLCILNFHEGAAKSISENMVLLKLTL